MIELAFFLFHPVPSATIPYQGGIEAATRRRSPVRCDDGSSPRDLDGSPNWDCELRGCSPLAPVCWSDRLDFCFDDLGDDMGVCAWAEPQHCDSRLTCFDLWTSCDGKYECHEDDSWIGCTNGTCTPKPSLITQSSSEAIEECLPEISASSTLSIERTLGTSRHLSVSAADDTVRGHGDV